jgi:hypothetical protein
MSFKTALKLEKYFRTDKRHFCMIKYEYDLYMLEQDPSFQKELTDIQAVRRMSGAAAKKRRRLRSGKKIGCVCINTRGRTSFLNDETNDTSSAGQGRKKIISKGVIDREGYLVL